MLEETSTAAEQNLSPAPAKAAIAWQMRLAPPIFSLIAGVSIGFICWALWQRDTTPALDDAALAKARQHWKAANIQNYSVTIRVEGNQPATYRVWVENGNAVKAERNGNALRQVRTFETWSVPGMFGTIERDLTENSRPGNANRLVLRARFDSQTGLPRRYRRLAYSGGGDVDWEVTQFDLVETSP